MMYKVVLLWLLLFWCLYADADANSNSNGNIDTYVSPHALDDASLCALADGSTNTGASADVSLDFDASAETDASANDFLC